MVLPSTLSPSIFPATGAYFHEFSYALQRTISIFFSDNAVIRSSGYTSACIRTQNNNKTVNANADDADGGEMRMSDANVGIRRERRGR